MNNVQRFTKFGRMVLTTYPINGKLFHHEIRYLIEIILLSNLYAFFVTWCLHRFIFYLNIEPCLWGRSPKGGVPNLKPITLGEIKCLPRNNRPHQMPGTPTRSSYPALTSTTKITAKSED
jgi:hypothetical protein